MSNKQTQRRRAEKSQARYERAAALRRERRIVAWVLAVVLVLVAAAIWVVVAQEGDEPTATPTTARQYDAPPPAAESLGQTWNVTLTTNVGDIVLELDGDAAPQAVASFLMLGRDGYFDGSSCHRLLPESLLQCGDPLGTGLGTPGYSFGPIENPPADQLYTTGTVAMARVGGDGNSMGSQFFLVFNDVTLPDDAAGGYTRFGTVVQGLEILQSVGAAGTQTGTQDGPPATAVIIEEVTIS